MAFYVKSLFNFDSIAMVMLPLIVFIGACIGSFSFRYMKGDTRYRMFFLYLLILLVSIGLLVCSDHIFLFLTAWLLSNSLLIRLMIHKPNWKAAKNSGMLAAKNYLFGALCITGAFLLLYLETGETSITALTQQKFKDSTIAPILLLLLIGGMTQSAIWPFHRWLVSSLNSPTPISAVMHAGLVNGGGFLIARFAPLYFNTSYFLDIMLLIGIITAIMGTFWKLLQNDIKRTLAFSTMGQMGFMLAQCGLGLFPAALAHLVTHGMFKAYLFLASGSAAQEIRYKTNYPPKAFLFISSLASGFLASYCFSIASGKPWFVQNTTMVLTAIVFLTASQTTLSVLSSEIRFRFPIAFITSSTLSIAYGSIVALITKGMEPAFLNRPQPLNYFHIGSIALLTLSWISLLFFENIRKINPLQKWISKVYVTALNKSQPHPETITTYRNYYKYL